MSVTVYTKPACVQCDATARALRKAGIPFATVDLTEDPAALELVKKMGHQQAPVVVTDTESWAGFHPGRIKALTA